MLDLQKVKNNPVLGRIFDYLRTTNIAVTKADKLMSSGNGRLGKMLSNNTIPKGPFIEKFLQTFSDVNKVWLETGEGEMLLNNKNENRLKTEPRKTMGNAKYIGDFHESEYEDGSRFRRLGPDTFAMKVELVTERAKAGWLRGFADSEYVEDLPMVEVPVDFVAKGMYLAFEVDGDSMDDDTIRCIPDKSIIVGRELQMDKWKPRLYNQEWPNWIFVHKRDGILVKQIADQDIEAGWIIHHSLNPNKELYPDEKIYVKDLIKIYNVVKRILP